MHLNAFHSLSLVRWRQRVGVISTSRVSAHEITWPAANACGAVRCRCRWMGRQWIMSTLLRRSPRQLCRSCAGELPSCCLHCCCLHYCVLYCAVSCVALCVCCLPRGCCIVRWCCLVVLFGGVGLPVLKIASYTCTVSSHALSPVSNSSCYIKE